MNILFLSLGQFENINDQGIYHDLIREFINNGHNVFVISPREKRTQLPTEHSIESGVEFLRVRIGNITKTNLIEKGISTVRIESLFLRELKKFFGNVKFDLVLYSTPPITFDRVIKYVKRRDGAKSYLLLKDIFPQNAVDLGVFSKYGLFYRYFRRREKELYKHSDYIGCMSKANVKYLLKHNNFLVNNNVEVCPNSIDPINIDVSEELKLKIRTQYGLPGNKTIFIYGGNLGKPQGLDFVIKCLRENEYNSNSFFLIVGSGTELGKLESFFSTEKLKNSMLIKQLPKKEYEMLANSCHVGLIFLDHRFTIPNFPSRLLSYMQASIPVLAATDVNTDVGQVIEEGEFGFWCESKDVDRFNFFVNQLCDKDLRTKLGKNARIYLENHYSVANSYKIIMEHLKD